MAVGLTHPAPRLRAGVVLALLGIMTACGGSDSSEEAVVNEASPAMTSAVPDIQASNAFYYYRDVEAAHRFYTDVLGFETVSDFGFAKILRIAETSYLTLVDEQNGQHSADEPKSVTLAVVTEQVEGWYDWLTSQDVPMRAELRVEEGRAHDGFVAIDPEGYLLEFERFNPHEENVDLMPALSARPTVATAGGGRPVELEVQATVFWLYYADIPAAQAFYETLLDVPLMVDQGWAKVYPVSTTGYIGLVDGERGLHQATEEKAVTLSFLTTDVQSWLDRTREQGVSLRNDELGDESGRVATFVGFDPEGYYLEWDTFLDVEGNERLLELLAQANR